MPITIAIIEDNPEFRQRFIDIIDAAPDLALVGCAIDGAQGRALIAASRADVFLIDLGLPDIDGTVLIREAIATHPGCDVMVISVFADDAHVLASIEAGATGYLLKDSMSAAIVDCIHTLVAGGSPVSPMIARRILQKLRATPAAPAARVVKPEVVPGAALLTEREVQILGLLGKGLSYGEIGAALFISAHTVAQHIKNIYRKLAVHSRGEAVYAASKLGMVVF
ncbi:MAG: response regulator transcription factor [Herminiimonas sp.]|nr:response regulator transcription factor [Herminiimonas sp.]